MKISWFLIDRGQRKPRTDKMRGPGLLWDAVCECGWDSATGGVKMGEARALVNDHKADHGMRPAGPQDASQPAIVREMTVQDIELQQARDLIASIDRMPAQEGVKAIATDRAQRALELVGKASSRNAGTPLQASTADAEDEA